MNNIEDIQKALKALKEELEQCDAAIKVAAEVKYNLEKNSWVKKL